MQSFDLFIDLFCTYKSQESFEITASLPPPPQKKKREKKRGRSGGKIVSKQLLHEGKLYSYQLDPY